MVGGGGVRGSLLRWAGVQQCCKHAGGRRVASGWRRLPAAHMYNSSGFEAGVRQVPTDSCTERLCCSWSGRAPDDELGGWDHGRLCTLSDSCVGFSIPLSARWVRGSVYN